MTHIFKSGMNLFGLKITNFRKMKVEWFSVVIFYIITFVIFLNNKLLFPFHMKFLAFLNNLAL